MNILKQFIPVTLFFALACISSPIVAQSSDIPMRGPISFAGFDTNRDGFVSEEEFNAVRGERMAARAAEGRPMRGAASAPSFSALDTDGDGQLTQIELAAGQKAQMEKRRRIMGMGRGYGPGMGQGFGPGMGRGYGPGMGQGFGPGMGRGFGPCMGQGFGPGMRQGNPPSFNDIDTNGDGAISPDEFNAHRAQRRQQRAQ